MNLPSSRGRGRRAPMADINVTPLVDVMLVLLIIFMVTAPLMTAGVPVNLPDARAKALDQEQKPVEISMDETGALFIDQDQVTDDALPIRLGTRKADTTVVQQFQPQKSHFGVLLIPSDRLID